MFSDEMFDLNRICKKNYKLKNGYNNSMGHGETNVLKLL